MEHINANLPLEAIKSIALENNQPLEKKDVSIGFIPITCATPIIMAEPMGFYHRHGLNMSLKKASDWEVVKNWAMKDEIDAAHMLCTMPLAMTLGLESSPKKFVMPAVEDNNGSALTIHRKYNSIKTTQEMKGMTIAIPYKFSMHNYLLRYYLAENQLNPDKDITIIEVPPPKMLEALEKGEIDAFFAPDPFNQLAVLNKIGFIYLLSKEIWDGHPCCAFSVSEEFTQQCPNTFKALFKAIVDATLFCSSMNNRKHIAKIIAPEPYLNQPVEILEQVLLGQYPDGRGVWKREPRRIHFDPFPWQSMAVWILTQMKRWGQVSDDFNFRDIAEKVYLAEDCDNEIKCLGYKKRGKSYTQHKIMNKVFDPFKAQQYLDSF
jgi:nitrate/nitrite transport system substrate-binding protein